jgi:hypothetical protein
MSYANVVVKILVKMKKMLGPHLRESSIFNAFVVRPEGLEPPTNWFEASDSIRLSYGRKEGNVLLEPI